MKQILQMMIANPEITRSELAEKTHKSNSTVFRMIEKLKSENYIKRIGPTKGGYWEILSQCNFPDSEALHNYCFLTPIICNSLHT